MLTLSCVSFQLYSASDDYAMVDGVVVFPEGSTEGDKQCINVTILEDDIVEGTETFTLTASTMEASSLIVIDPSLSQTTVSIADSASKIYSTFSSMLPYTCI